MDRFKRDDAMCMSGPARSPRGDIGKAIGNAIAAYTKSSGKPIWGITIMVDKA